jgi:hypothetical protein
MTTPELPAQVVPSRRDVAVTVGSVMSGANLAASGSSWRWHAPAERREHGAERAAPQRAGTVDPATLGGPEPVLDERRGQEGCELAGHRDAFEIGLVMSPACSVRPCGEIHLGW